MGWSFGYKVMLVALCLVPLLGWGGAAYLALSGDDPKEDHYRAARELYQQAKYEEAIAENDEVLWLDSSVIRALSGRGDALFALGRMHEALQDYDHTISLRSSLVLHVGSPGYSSHWEALAGAYNGRALYHTERGSDMEAQRNLAEVEQLGIDVTEAREAVAAIKAKR